MRDFNASDVFFWVSLCRSEVANSHRPEHGQADICHPTCSEGCAHCQSVGQAGAAISSSKKRLGPIRSNPHGR